MEIPMSNQLAKIEEYEQFFTRRYRLKKAINAVLCFIIAFWGISALLYSAFVLHDNLFHYLRYMTFDGTIFTTVTSLLRGIACIQERRKDFEITDRKVFFLRLSSATTELVILAVVLFGLSPLVPDNPDISTYTGIVMHLVMPFLTLFSFLFNDAPIGKLKPLEVFQGTTYITIYAIIMMILFGFRILPSSMAPYSFLNFDTTSLLYKLECLIGIYAAGYAISLVLSKLNRQLSWIWFIRPKNREAF